MERTFTLSSLKLAFTAFALIFIQTLSAQTNGDFRSKNSGGWHGNAIGTLVISGGVVTGVTISSGGSGYTAAPTMTINNGGSNFTGTASISNGAVSGVSVTTGGTSYSTSSAVLFSVPATQYGNWESWNGSAWIDATALPTSTNNVTIRAGHIVTISNATANCKNLIIEEGATLNSPNVALGNVQTLIVKGDITNNGVLGTTGALLTKGEGLRVYLDASPTVNISGTGITKIGGLSVNPNNANAQDIFINQNMELRRSSSGNSTAIQLQNGTNGSAAKSLTVSAGVTVKLNGGSPNGSAFHVNQGSAVTVPTATNGNMTYNIEGELDCSTTQFNLVTTSSTSSAGQILAVNVKNGGTLKLGSQVRLYQTQAGQKVYLSVENGGTLDTSSDSISITAALATNVGATNAYSWIALAQGAIYKTKASKYVVNPIWIGSSTSNYNPITLKPSNTSVFTIGSTDEVASGTGIASADKLIRKIWSLSPATTPGSTDMSFGYNTADANTGNNPASAMNLFNFNTNTSAWQMAVSNSATPASGTGTTYTASFAGVSNFDGIKFAIGNSGTLPLSLLSFTASQSNGLVSLNWLTAQENNVKKFVVERSFDGIVFSLIGVVAAGSGSYHLADVVNSNGYGTQYYRLQVWDNDGSVSGTFYASVKVKALSEVSVANAFPNPVTGSDVTVTHALTHKGAKAEIYSVSGTKLLEHSLAEGVNQSVLNVGSLQSGVYFIAIKGADAVQVIRIIK